MVSRDDLLPYDKTRLSKVLQSEWHVGVLETVLIRSSCPPRWWTCRVTVLCWGGWSFSIGTTSRCGSGKKWVLMQMFMVSRDWPAVWRVDIVRLERGLVHDTSGCLSAHRRFQWTQTRRQSLLMMVQSSIMTSSSSQQAAGLLTHFKVVVVVSPLHCTALLMNRIMACPLEQRVWTSLAWSWTMSRCWRHRRTLAKSTPPARAATWSSWELLLWVNDGFLSFYANLGSSRKWSNIKMKLIIRIDLKQICVRLTPSCT